VEVVFRARKSDPERTGLVFPPAQIDPLGPLWREIVGVALPGEPIEFVCDSCCIDTASKVESETMKSKVFLRNDRGRINDDR
jgi:hypothetical protein